MTTLHQSLADFRHALGYDESRGVCALYSNMAINAFLVGELEQFDRRCDYIQEKMANPDFVNLVKKIGASGSASKKSYSPMESAELPKLRDAMAFIDSGELYLKTHLYGRVFNKKESIINPIEIGKITSNINA